MHPTIRTFFFLSAIAVVACGGSKGTDPGTPGKDGGNPVDSGAPTFDAGTPQSDAGGQTDGGAILPNVPNLIICQPATDPWVHKSELSPTTTRYQSCATVCSDQSACAVETTARGRTQVELSFVVDEDGQGNGFGGTLRYTKDGARDHVVLFHKGGAGTEYVDDVLPQKVENAGGTAVEPKWVEEVDTKVGWFSRPFAESKLERNLFGVSLRPAAVIKWVRANLATAPISTAGCSGGSIATYYPRHWHGLDPALRYQLLSGGPVMSKIQAGCGSSEKGKGRCTLTPTIECTSDTACQPTGGTCSPYQWRRLDIVMKAVRGTIDHLHAKETSGSTDCDDSNVQPAFDASDFNSPTHPMDQYNEHRIDFMVNVGDSLADDYLNVLASGAAVYSGLTGEKSWTAQTTGVHCDSFKTEAAWKMLKAGSGL